VTQSTRLTKWLICLFLCCLTDGHRAAAEESRPWHDVSGRVIQATFRGLELQSGDDGEKLVVQLKLTSGRVSAVPVEKLSQDDREYIVELVRKSLTSIAPADRSATKTGASEPSQTKDEATDQPKPTPLSDRNSAKQALERKALIEIVNLPLTEAVDQLRQKYAVPIEIDREGLAKAKVSLDTRVALPKANLTLQGALTLLCVPQGLGTIFEKGEIVICSRERAAKTTYVVRYKVRDLVKVGRGTDFATLIAAITENVKPSSWVEAGGPCRMKIVPESSSLDVTANDEVHAALEEFLKAKRGGKR
jgi:hypothetical protein